MTVSLPLTPAYRSLLASPDGGACPPAPSTAALVLACLQVSEPAICRGTRPEGGGVMEAIACHTRGSPGVLQLHQGARRAWKGDHGLLARRGSHRCPTSCVSLHSPSIPPAATQPASGSAPRRPPLPRCSASLRPWATRRRPSSLLTGRACRRVPGPLLQPSRPKCRSAGTPRSRAGSRWPGRRGRRGSCSRPTTASSRSTRSEEQTGSCARP